jgi:hypothetical protein
MVAGRFTLSWNERACGLGVRQPIFDYFSHPNNHLHWLFESFFFGSFPTVTEGGFNVVG